MLSPDGVELRDALLGQTEHDHYALDRLRAQAAALGYALVPRKRRGRRTTTWTFDQRRRLLADTGRLRYDGEGMSWEQAALALARTPAWQAFSLGVLIEECRETRRAWIELLHLDAADPDALLCAWCRGPEMGGFAQWLATLGYVRARADC